MRPERYDSKSCASLMGYGREVHKRSGAVCVLCGAGRDIPLTFDFWRQLSVEHLISKSQKGYRDQIEGLLARHLPDLSREQRDAMARQIDDENTYTVCRFCNSTTSRELSPTSMEDLLWEASGTPDQIVEYVIQHLRTLLRKRLEDARWKLKWLREDYESDVRLELETSRRAKQLPIEGQVR